MPKDKQLLLIFSFLLFNLLSSMSLKEIPGTQHSAWYMVVTEINKWEVNCKRDEMSYRNLSRIGNKMLDLGCCNLRLFFDKESLDAGGTF